MPLVTHSLVDFSAHLKKQKHLFECVCVCKLLSLPPSNPTSSHPAAVFLSELEVEQDFPPPTAHPFSQRHKLELTDLLPSVNTDSSTFSAPPSHLLFLAASHLGLSSLRLPLFVCLFGPCALGYFHSAASVASCSHRYARKLSGCSHRAASCLLTSSCPPRDLRGCSVAPAHHLGQTACDLIRTWVGKSIKCLQFSLELHHVLLWDTWAKLQTATKLSVWGF